MKTDKELLELAAKAAEIRIDKSQTNGGGYENTGFDMLGNAVLDWHHMITWNPLVDDGDALRLAVKLGISITPYPIYESPKHSVIAKKYLSLNFRAVNEIESLEIYNDDQYAATRRAIVRCAAEIGKGMK